MPSLFEYKGQLSFDMHTKYFNNSLSYDDNEEPTVMLVNGREALVAYQYSKIVIVYKDTREIEVFMFPEEDKEVALRHYFFSLPSHNFLEMSYSETGIRDGKYYVESSAMDVQKDEYVDGTRIDPETGLFVDDNDGELVKTKPFDPSLALGKDAYDALLEYQGMPGVSSSSFIGDRSYEDSEQPLLSNILYNEKLLDTAFNRSGKNRA